jgi:alpha-tubulin suppressor-like RCC1 family protein
MKIIQISCSMHHTFFVTAKGDVYGCGSNAHAELGYDEDRNNVQYPVLCFSFPAAKSRVRVDCGARYSIAYCCEDDQTPLSIFPKLRDVINSERFTDISFSLQHHRV